MAAFTWAYDKNSGAYQSHALSKKLRFAAICDTVFTQFAKPVDGFGKRKGETVTITKIKNLTTPTSSALNESTRIPIDTFDIASGTITVEELGRGVEYTSLADDLSFFSLLNPIQRKLKDQLAIVMDGLAATQFKATYVVAVPTAASTITWDTDGTLSETGVNNLGYAHCGLIRDYMRDTLTIPWYEKSRYMGIASTKALRGIKSDGEFQAWRQYLEPGEVLYNSEVGTLEQIRFIESNNTSALSNAKGTGSVLGEAVIFGDDAVGLAEVQAPELRAAIPGDFGRSKAVAWYGVLAYGIIWASTATAGEARIVYISSA